MKGWSALLDQTARQLMAEVERLEPNSMVLALAKAVFINAEESGVRPSGRRPNWRADQKRETRAARDARDRIIVGRYLGGESMLEISGALGCSQGYVSAALYRQGVTPRAKGPRKGTGVDFDRIERVRQARADGDSLETIGAREHISRERVRQICVANGIPHKANDQLTAAQLEAVQEYVGGGSLNYVAARHGVGSHALRGWVIRAGYVPRKTERRWAAETRRKAKRAVDLYRRKVPTTEIADTLGIKPENIYRLLAMEGVKPDRKPRSGRRGLRS